MKKSSKAFILALLQCFITGAVLAQSDTTAKKNKIYIWATAGIQAGFADDLDFMAGEQLALNFSLNQRNFVQLKGYEMFSFSHWPIGDPKPQKLIYIRNVSALYGIGGYKTESFAIIPSIGLSFGEAIYRGEILYIDRPSPSSWFGISHPVFAYDEFYYLGIPVNVSFMLTSPRIGVSADVYANIHKHPDYGISLNVHLGKIRDWKYKLVRVK